LFFVVVGAGPTGVEIAGALSENLESSSRFSFLGVGGPGQFSTLTGWRKGETASLRCEDVDGDVIRLRSENSKNREGRTVPLVGEFSGADSAAQGCTSS
jgi:hypothetical protein